MSPRLVRTNFSHPNSVDFEAVKRNGFHDQGILVARIDHPQLTWPEKEFLKQIGEKLYGKRVQRGAA